MPARAGRTLAALPCINAEVRNHVAGCWQISRRVWKYPSRRCSSVLRESNSAAFGWRSESVRSHSGSTRDVGDINWDCFFEAQRKITEVYKK